MAKNKHTFPVPEGVYLNVRNCTSHLSDREHRFIAHLLESSLVNLQRRKSTWIPVPYDKYRYVKWRSMEERKGKGIINSATFDRASKKCREFKLNSVFVESIVNDIENSCLTGKPYKIVDLYSGKEVTRRTSSKLKDNAGITEPKLIRESIHCIKPRLFNRTLLIEYLLNEKSITSGLKGTQAYEKQSLRYLNNLFCWSAVQNQMPLPVTTDIYQYGAAYEVQMSGRIGEVFGGLQNVSREMKEFVYKNINDLHNYDLSSSQVRGLIQQFNQAGVSVAWLEAYLENPKAKENYASTIGVDVDTWKACLIALLMGGSIKKGHSVHKKLQQYCIDNGKAISDADDCLMSFKASTEELRKDLSKWHRYLLNDYPSAKFGYRYKGKRYLKNPAGKKLCIDDLIKNKKGKIAAFVLQGYESAFIHHLTIVSNEFDYEVIGNEHDGVITIGAIPEEAINRASSLSGLLDPVLVKKSFV